MTQPGQNLPKNGRRPDVPPTESIQEVGQSENVPLVHFICSFAGYGLEAPNDQVALEFGKAMARLGLDPLASIVYQVDFSTDPRTVGLKDTWLVLDAYQKHLIGEVSPELRMAIDLLTAVSG